MSDRQRKFDVLSQHLKFHAFPDETNNQYCITEVLVPVGMGAPPHTHAGEGEGFFVIEGQIGFMVDGEEILKGAGEFVPIPDGAVHAFQAVGDKPARALIVSVPGQLHEQFFTEVGTPLPDDFEGLPEPSVPDFAKVMAIAEKAGMTILPPS